MVRAIFKDLFSFNKWNQNKKTALGVYSDYLCVIKTCKILSHGTAENLKNAWQEENFLLSDIKCLAFMVLFPFYLKSRPKVCLQPWIKKKSQQQQHFRQLISLLPWPSLQQREEGMGRIQFLIDYSRGESSPAALSDCCSLWHQ